MREKPKAIGRYDVERLLGEGGMGVVWLARDTVLGRLVAVKVLRDDLALPPKIRDELVERMRHEARAAAAVSHPNIVTLHDMGEDDAVGLYLVFEYVDGESLRERLKRGPLALTDIAKLSRDLGDALSYAHEAGVVHRDVKPENILFSRTGAKIADFGIARIPDSNLTQANTVLGTPAYTSPEALGKGEFGPRSDQFGLAATIYEAMTGVRAFGSEDPITTAGKVSNDTPPPIDASLASPNMIRALESVIFRGLAKDPAERFPTCVELGEHVARTIERPRAETIEIERTPLSSRIALKEKASLIDRAVLPPELTPRPSIVIRKKTHRFQNILAALALLVIIALVLLGRKRREEDPAAHDPDAAVVLPIPPPPATLSAKPRTSASPRVRPPPTAAPKEDAAAPPVNDE